MKLGDAERVLERRLLWWDTFHRDSELTKNLWNMGTWKTKKFKPTRPVDLQEPLADTLRFERRIGGAATCRAINDTRA